MPLRPDLLHVDQLLANLDGVRRLAGALVRDPYDAEDLTQETVLAALESPPRAGWDMRAWLGGVMRNKARRLRRTESRRRRRERGAAREDQVPSTAEVSGRVAEQKRVLDAITRLSPAQQQVIWLRFFEDLPPRVLAVRLGVPVETVRTRIKRALAGLRLRLDEQHDGRRSAWVGALVPFLAPGTASSPPAWIGGALMTTKSKTAAAVLVVAAICLGLYQLLAVSGDDATRDTDGGTVAADVPSDSAAGLETRERPPPEPRAGADEKKALTWSFPVLARTPGDEPIVDAEIRIGSPAELAWERLPLAGTTGPDGRYEARLDPEGGAARIVARAEGRLPVAKSVQPSDSDPVLLRLPAVRTLHFLVRDGDTGRPLAGVVCESFAAEGGFEVLSRSISDDGGRVAVPDTAGHRLAFLERLRFRKDGYVPRATVRKDLLEHGAAAADAPRTLYLFPGRGLRLRVLDARDRPVPGARVQAWTGSSRVVPSLVFGPQAPELSHAASLSLGTAVSDDRGVVTLGVPLEGWNAWFAVAYADGRTGFELRNGFAGRNDIEADIHLHDAYRVEGLVVDEEEKPLRGAEVGYGLHAVARGVDPQRATPGAPPELQARTVAVTDAEGRFVLEGVPVPERGLPLFVQRAGMESKTESVFPDSSATVLEPRIVMQRNAQTLLVRVRDVGGKPIAGAWVTWRRMKPYARSNDAGEAVIDRRPRAILPLLVTAPGYGTRLRDVESTEIELEITLTPGRTVQGRVEDATGAPSAAYVDVFRAVTAALPDEERAKMQIYGRTWITRVTAADDGRFHLRDMPPEPLFLRAFRFVSGALGASSPVQAEGLFEAGQDVVLRLSDAPGDKGEQRSIAGTVRTDDGRRLTRYNLQLRRLDPELGKGRALQPVQTGWAFRFEGVAPGAYEIRATQPDGAYRGRQRIQVPRDRDLEGVVVKVVASGALRGHLVLPDGVGASGSGVMAYLVGGTGRVRGYGLVEAGGAFTIPNLAPGRYTLRLQLRGDTAEHWQARADEHVVRAGSETTVEVRVVKAGRIVLVLDNERFATSANQAHLMRDQERGRRTLLSTVTATSTEGVERTAQGLLHGRHVQGWALPPGVYQLRIDAGEEGTFETSVTVRGHEDAEVHVRLTK